VIAFVAHFYGVSPLVVEDWFSKEIEEWYDEAVKIENEKWKALNKKSDG